MVVGVGREKGGGWVGGAGGGGGTLPLTWRLSEAAGLDLAAGDTRPLVWPRRGESLTPSSPVSLALWDSFTLQRQLVSGGNHF